MIYHEVRQIASGSTYRQGLALFDLEHPDIGLQRGDSWIFSPEAPTSVLEMCTTSCFPAVKPSLRMGIPPNCITEQPNRALV